MIDKTHHLVPLLAAVAACTAPLAQAQTVPDAGRVQRESQPPTLQPPPAALEIRLEPATPEQTAPGGPRVTVRQVEFTGNTLISTEVLQAAVADQRGRSLDLAGLRSMAQQVSALYQASGYPFARAFLLPQTVQDGVIKLGVLEGRYGQVKAEGDTKLAAQAQPFLQELKPGQVIETGLLSRTLLLLGDQPGVQVTPLVRPGQETGTGDLMVTVSPSPLVRVDAGYDNHGTRYTGVNRLRLNAQFDSPFSLGDQVFARWVYTDGNLWLGSMSYGRPLGHSGLRMTANASRTSYWLGKDFASLDASGTADTLWLSLSYPLVRSTTSNATLGASLQRKQLRDIQRAVQSDERKSTQSLPLSLQFDRRDGLGGSGITYGSVSWTLGDLRLQGQSLTADTDSGRSAQGSFSKWNLDLARVQALGSAGLSLFLRLSAQQANNNLDSSEKFSLGGPSGVRAFPIGEGNGDSGAYAQVELRASIGAFSPYAFFDTGRATLNARNSQLVAPLATNSRSVAGAGAGVRFRQESWDLDGVVAHQTRGGAAQSERGASATRAWATVTYRF